MKALLVLPLALAAANLGANETLTIYQFAGQVQCFPGDGVPVAEAADLLRAQGLKVRSAERRHLPIDIGRHCGAPAAEANVLTLSVTDWAAFTAKNPDAGGYGVWTFDDGQVEVYMYDGTLQCGQGEEIPLARQEEMLTSKGIEVLKSHKGTDGFLHIAVCGASTGAINIFAIKPDDLAAARELGFSRLITQEMTEGLMRPLPRSANSSNSRDDPATGAIPLLW
ncbi:MAG: hypothetical protein WAT23_05135 [Chromatiaceae bacterium]